MNRASIALSWCAIVLMAVFVLGCGSSRKTYPVKGTVTFPDGRPLTQGTVECQIGDGPQTVTAHGTIDDRGEFELFSVVNNRKVEGACEGTHRVIVVAIGERGVHNVHPRFSSYETSGLEFTVKPEENRFPITVEKPPRGGR